MTVIATLQDLAEELDVHFTRLSKAKIGGSAAGIVGGVLGIVGLALTPFTFGASLGLTIAGTDFILELYTFRSNYSYKI